MIKSVFILGATSLIARSLCIDLAKKGCEKFYLISRKINNNKDFVSDFQNKFSVKVIQEELDLYENFLSKKSFLKYEDFDLYIILAGYLGNELKARIDSQESLKIAVINYLGIVPLIDNILTNDRIKRKGRMWIFSSVAADMGRPSNYHYGASKSALTKHCQGLYNRCFRKPFKIRIIKAGFMSTPMSEGKVPKFLSISPKKVSYYLLKNPNKSGIEYLPFWWTFIMFFIQMLPRSIISKL